MVRRQPFHSTTPSSIGFTNFKSSPRPKWKVCTALNFGCFSGRFVCVVCQVSAGKTRQPLPRAATTAAALCSCNGGRGRVQLDGGRSMH